MWCNDIKTKLHKEKLQWENAMYNLKFHAVFMHSRVKRKVKTIFLFDIVKTIQSPP